MGIASLAHSIPSVFQRPIQFHMAMADMDSPLRRAVLGEWRGLMAVFCLAEWAHLRVSATEFSVPQPPRGATSSVGNERVGDLHFKSMLYFQLPYRRVEQRASPAGGAAEGATRRVTDWEKWWVIKCNDTLLGATSPWTLLYTASEYKAPSAIPWQSADNKLIDPIDHYDPSQGSRSITVENTTEYALFAQGPGGAVSGRTQVRAEHAGPPEISFEAIPSAVHPGEAVTLTWSVRFADSVSIDSGIGKVASSGNIQIHPFANAHYTMQTTGSGGSSSRDVFISVSRLSGPSRGQIVWTGQVHGTQLVSIERDHADAGQVVGSLPGEPCILQLVSDKNVSIASAPGPRNNYERIVLRVKGNGPMRVAIEWVIQ
jgi:hypothetical protein